MKLLRITGCGDCPHSRRRSISAPDLAGFCENEMVCDICDGIYAIARLPLRETCLNKMEFNQVLSRDQFIIFGCPLPDAPETEEKE